MPRRSFFLGETYYLLFDGKGGDWGWALSDANNVKNNFYSALWWYQRAAVQGDDDAARMASVLGKRYTIEEEKMPSSHITFPYSDPLDFQVEEWCRHYEFLCLEELPSLMGGFDVPAEMLKYDPCLVWLILKNPDWDNDTKNYTMDAYKMSLNTVKSTYLLYAQLLRKQYDLSLPPMQRMD